MNNKRFVGIFAAIFIVSATPLLLVQPSGVATAGLSAGFVVPLASVPHMILMIVVGVVAALLGWLASAMLPTCFFLMTLVGGLLDPIFVDIPITRFYILTAILMFAIAVSLVGTRIYLISAIVFSSIAYNLGLGYSSKIPDIAPPLYYILGVQTCILLLLATGVSLGYSIAPELKILLRRLRARIPENSFISLFF